MRGLVIIEFIVALAIFIAAFMFVILAINQRVPLLNEARIYNDIVAEGYEISNVITFTEGDAEIIGLSNGTSYFISETKLQNLNNYCLNLDIERLVEFRKFYSERVLVDDGVDKLLYLNIYKLNSSNQWVNMWNCGNPDDVDNFSVKTVVERFAVLDTDNSLLRLRFTVIE